MRKFIISGVVLALLSLPGVASAHSGHVSCDATGVVYSFDANFPANVLVTEHVSGNIDRTYIPPAFAVGSDTYPMPTVGVYTVSATWSGGGTIPPTTVNCPGTPPPPAPPPIIPPPTPPVPPAPPVVPPTVPPVCAKGTTQVSFVNNVLTCEKVKIHKVIKIKWNIRYVQWCQHHPKHHKHPGVTG